MSSRFDYQLAEKYYKVIDPDGSAYQVNGNKYAVYLFDLAPIKDKIRRVQAEVTVSNDYKIQVAEILQKRLRKQQHREVMIRMVIILGHYDASFWKTMAQADGNIKDGSNLRTVTVEWGFEVQNLIYGFDVSFDYMKFKFNGEYITNVHRYQFPDGIPGTGIDEPRNTFWKYPVKGINIYRKIMHIT